MSTQNEFIVQPKLEDDQWKLTTRNGHRRAARSILTSDLMEALFVPISSFRTVKAPREVKKLTRTHIRILKKEIF